MNHVKLFLDTQEGAIPVSEISSFDIELQEKIDHNYSLIAEFSSMPAGWLKINPYFKRLIHHLNSVLNHKYKAQNWIKRVKK